jgi:urea transport system permease protein
MTIRLPSPASAAHDPIRWILSVACALMLLAAPLWSADASSAAPVSTPAPSGPLSASDLDAALLSLGDDKSDHKAIIQRLGASGDARLAAVLDHYGKGDLAIWHGHAVIVLDTVKLPSGDKVSPIGDVLTQAASPGAPAEGVPIAQLTAIDAGRRERMWARDAGTLLNLADPDREVRLAAVVKAGDNADAKTLPALLTLVGNEKDGKVLNAAKESISLIHLGSSDPGERLAAIRDLGARASARAQGPLQAMLDAKPDATTTTALANALGSIAAWQTKARWFGYIFSGLSLGSVLVLMALGLSIVFGLMGVINMAHGELMMIGAYATYVTQNIFAWGITHFHLSPGMQGAYFVCAIPAAFLASAATGWLIEALIVRHLYGRPLETLLATFGVSIILIKIVKDIFGNNIAVNSPSWLQGGCEVMQDVTLPYARCFIIIFTIVVIVAMYLVMERTRLGLLLRATTQNRGMAAALGVPTRRIDGMTFALGSGIAGLAGCALTLIGGVTPDMGRNYIVDSFMVVVTGGVGKLAGAIWAGMGLGCLNKVFEPLTGAVWGKVLILLCVIVMLQWRPSGLFPAKGRHADV